MSKNKLFRKQDSEKDADLAHQVLKSLGNVERKLVQVTWDQLVDNPFQPRKVMSAKGIESLSRSIAQEGVLSPILGFFDPDRGKYVILAGHRRVIAAREARLPSIPLIVLSADGAREMRGIALVENLLREDLHPVDEARALQQAIDEEFKTQENLGRYLGIPRSTLAAKLRVLALGRDLLDACLQLEGLTFFHLQSLLKTPEKLRSFAFEQLKAKLSGSPAPQLPSVKTAAKTNLFKFSGKTPSTQAAFRLQVRFSKRNPDPVEQTEAIQAVLDDLLRAQSLRTEILPMASANPSVSDRIAALKQRIAELEQDAGSENPHGT